MVLDFVTPTPLGTRWGKLLKYFRSEFVGADFSLLLIKVAPKTQIKNKQIKKPMYLFYSC